MSAPSSQPSFGYVIVTLPHTSNFQPVGRHFSLSYLPQDIRFDQANKLTICLWLGPAPVVADTPPIAAFLIWSSKSRILPIGPSLSAAHPSNVIAFEFSQTEELNLSSSTNVVFHELLHINDNPCIAFVKQDVDVAAIAEEAKSLSFTKLAFDMVFDCMKYLDGRKLAGDALESSALQEWFIVASEKVESEDPTSFLLDPTVLIAGIVAHLGKTILEDHKFDINRREVIMIPFIFISSWATKLLYLLEGKEKELTVKAVLKSV